MMRRSLLRRTGHGEKNRYRAGNISVVPGIDVKSIIVAVVGALLLASCAGNAVRSGDPETSEVRRKEEIRNGRHRYVEEARFIRGTRDPLEIKYYKASAGGEILCREKKYHYSNGIVQRVDYYVFLNEKKTKTGKVVYYTKGYRPEKFEYYSIGDIYDRKINLAGMDMYAYLEGDGLESRRIIEYAYDTTTGTRMQLSQYVIKYENEKPVSMKSWILDVHTNKLIVKDEDNGAVIAESIKNIEKSLQERSQGTKYLEANCQ